MKLLPGSVALSPFRQHRLLERLRELEPAIEQVSARYLHIVDVSNDLTPEEKNAFAQKNIAYVDHEFNFENIVKQWDNTLENVINNFKKNTSKKWKLKKISSDFVPSQNKNIQENVKLPTIDKNLMNLEKNIKAGFTPKKIERKSK